MDLYEELKAYMSTYHPSIKLGNEDLAQIKYSEQHTPGNTPQNSSDQNLEPAGKARKKVAKKQGSQFKKEEKVVIDLDFPVKRPRESEASVCPICQWIFPSCYSEDDMSDHVNKCIDGQGAQDIKNFRKNSKKNKKKRRKPQQKGDDVKEIIEKYSNDEEIDKFEECPSCLLNLNSLPESFKEKHRMFCVKEQELVIKNIMKKY